MRHTTVIDGGPVRLRVTVELEPEPIEAEGVELPAPPRLPAEMRPTVRPGLSSARPALRLVTPKREVA